MKRRIILIALIIFGVCIIVYSANFRVVGAGDCWAPRYIPISLLKEGNLDLNEFPGLRFAVIENSVRGKTFRVFNSPVLSGVLATPVYLAAKMFGLPITTTSIAYLGKLAATIYTALSVAFVFLILKELLSVKSAAFLAVVYAFGTCSWTISSQSLWQHGLSQLFLGIALYCLFKASDNSAFAGYAGAFLSLATLARHLSGIIAIIMFIYVVYCYRSQIFRFILFSLPAAAFFFIYHWYYFGSPVSFGSQWVFGKFDAPFFPAVLGLLFSPNRGLFIFSSFFLFSVVGAIKVWKEKNNKYGLLYRYIIAAVLIYILIVSKWFTWWGGHCYGYRMLVDITPLLMILLVPAYNLISKRKTLKLLFVVGVTLSILIQLMGALYYSDYWNSKLKIDKYPERVWLIKSGQFHIMLKKAAQRGWKVQRTVLMPRRHRHHHKQYW